MKERKVDQIDAELRKFEESYMGKKARKMTWV